MVQLVYDVEFQSNTENRSAKNTAEYPQICLLGLVYASWIQ